MNSNKFAIYLCFLGFLSLGSNSSFAVCPDPTAYPSNDCSLPGVRPGGFPYFEQGVDIKVKNDKHGDMKKMKAKYRKSSASTLLVDQDLTYDISKTSLKFKAKTNKNGSVQGKVKIQGKIAELGINNKKPLMKAKLSGDWDFSDDGLLIGFDTNHIQCHKKLKAVMSCTTAESIYLVLDDPIDSKKHLRTTGTAVTTVPVPAAVWLLGSGLLVLSGALRRRHGRLMYTLR